MADTSSFNETNSPNGARDATGSASLINVPASAQMTPDAIERCPVCGLPYAVSGQPVTESLPPPDQPLAAQTTEEAAPADPTPPAGRVVMRCAYCGTYSVGAQPG